MRADTPAVSSPIIDCMYSRYVLLDHRPSFLIMASS